MNDISVLYKNFNTQLIKLRNNDTQSLNNNKNSKKNLIIPPLASITTGGLVSKIYNNNNIFKKAEKSKENFIIGLNQGYKTNNLYLQIQDEIKITNDKILKMEKEISDNATSIKNIINNGGGEDPNCKEIIKLSEDIIESNKTSINNLKKYLERLNTMLLDLYDNIVTKSFKKYTNNLINVTKKQSKNFTIAAMSLAVILGIGISFVINKTQKRKANK